MPPEYLENRNNQSVAGGHGAASCIVNYSGMLYIIP